MNKHIHSTIEARVAEHRAECIEIGVNPTGEVEATGSSYEYCVEELLA